MARRALNAAGDLTEAAWQAQVIGTLRAYRWELIYHAPDGGHAPAEGRRRVAGGQVPEGKGFPDVVAIHPPTARLLVAELKTRTGRVDPRQRLWLDGFGMIGQALREVAGELDEARLRDCVAPREATPSVEAYLWRPADWPDVHRIIRGGEEHRRELDPIDFG